MTEPFSRVSPDIEGPYAWRCCDTRYPHIYGIVTDRQLTLHAWREGGIEFQALYPRADAQQARTSGAHVAWQTVPLPATPEMIKAAERTDIEMRAQGFANAEPEAIYYAMLDAAPSSPAVDGATNPGMIERMVTAAMETARLEAIEECAKIAETAYSLMFPKPANRITAENAGHAAAAAIRALAMTSTHRAGGSDAE